MTTIFLIGYMASGKTTFGHALAAATGLKFIDLDQYIENFHNLTIGEIFAKYGEEEFRKIEHESLKRLAKEKEVIIACGGGTPCFFDNMDIMNRKGLTVWLRASEERLCERLIAENDSRPLVAGKSPDEIKRIISEQLDKRTPFYKRAHIHFSGENLESRQMIHDTVATFLTLFRSQIK